jgi:hypothetical protein
LIDSLFQAELDGMRYILLTYELPEDLESRRENARDDKYWSLWQTYVDSMSRAGIIESMHYFLPDYTATTLRLRSGRRLLRDGPYTDTNEQIGGYFVIDVANLDRALEWAEQCPAAATGAVEVRPLANQDDGGDCLL